MVSYKNDWKEDCQKLLRRDEDLNEIHFVSLSKYYFNLFKIKSLFFDTLLIKPIKALTCSWNNESNCKF